MGAAQAWAREAVGDPFAWTRARFEQVLEVAARAKRQQMKHSDLERLLETEGQETEVAVVSGLRGAAGAG